MIQILLLAAGSAVFPALLACVAILISRPEPHRLLIAFYAGGMSTSLVCGLVVLILFNRGESVIGSTQSAPHPAVSIVEGLLGLVLAWLMISRRARAPITRWHAEHPLRRGDHQKQQGPSWIDRHLDHASPGIAVGVGVVLNLPGPLYLLALGQMARDGYGTVEQLVLVVAFNLIMFLLLEVPLVGYTIRPQETAARIAAFGHWLNANGLSVMGCLVGVFAVSILLQGVIALLG